MQPGWGQPVRQEFMENECEALPGVAYPGVRDNRSTINTKTGYDDMMTWVRCTTFLGHSIQCTRVLDMLRCIVRYFIYLQLLYYSLFTGTVKGMVFDVKFSSDNNINGSGFYATYRVFEATPNSSVLLPAGSPVQGSLLHNGISDSIYSAFIGYCTQNCRFS